MKEIKLEAGQAIKLETPTMEFYLSVNEKGEFFLIAIDNHAIVMEPVMSNSIKIHPR